MSLVGRVVGTEDSTPLQFSVALAQDSDLQLDAVALTLRGTDPLGLWHLIRQLARTTAPAATTLAASVQNLAISQVIFSAQSCPGVPS